ncbi:sensor domain-containing diguanylate cyclase [Irregularibacter muris]|uniref:Sensor domain-containing diguanylate cyclase n=1 Tax=Irregularibacter muris TaxID=1796619 RepID=A0AAE3HIV3_9FIRM|nr:sensor domain-containing diguanylate cyclase [Irregularibacter muris]MCR1899659.1 sensor domain-containing diguanylate cyclase [Irregularibacter muris]
MKKSMDNLIIIAIFLLFAIGIGILLPPYFFQKNVQAIQINLTFITVALVLFLSYRGSYRNYIMAEKNLENNTNTIKEILHLTDIIIKIPNTEDLFDTILKKAVEIIKQAEKGSLIVLNMDNELEFKAVVGYDKEKIQNIKLNLEETFAYIKTNGQLTKPCIIRNISAFNEAVLDQSKYKALKSAEGLTVKTTLSCPIVIDGMLYGMINIDSSEINAFNNEDIDTMEFFSNQAGIVIKNHKLIDEVLYLSRHDSLTNVYNRRYFEELYLSFMEKTQESNRSFSLVYFDLDNLKNINDTFGHQAGDKAILSFVNTIKKNIRESDLLARYGGDEFIAIFFNADEESVKHRIHKIKRLLDTTPVYAHGKIVKVEFSYGIANYPEDNAELQNLIKKADKRMYEYKTNRLKDGA